MHLSAFHCYKYLKGRFALVHAQGCSPLQDQADHWSASGDAILAGRVQGNGGGGTQSLTWQEGACVSLSLLITPPCLITEAIPLEQTAIGQLPKTPTCKHPNYISPSPFW